MSKKFLPRSQIGQINLWDVELNDLDCLWRAGLTALGQEAARQILQEVVQRNIEVTFPYNWETSDGHGNERPYKATTIYVAIPLYPNDDNSVSWEYDLNDAITDIIDGKKSVDGTIVEGKKNLTELADAIEGMAKRLRDAAAEALS